MRFFGANPNAAKEDLDESKHTPGQDGGVSFIEVPCNPEVTASSDSVPSSTFSTARLSVSTGDAPKEPAATNPQSTANMRGADERLIAETNQVWTPRLVLFNELEKPMKELGAGEFCRAHLSKLDGRDVVVKMLKPEQRNNPTAVKDLLSEGALMMAMQHPNLLGAIAHGLDDYGLPFVVIEKLETVLSAELPKLDDSVPIWTRQAQVKKWPLTRALRTGLELAEALHYCHAEVATSVFPGCRILHRDLTPNNIGFLPDGRLALVDFGLAKLWRISADDLDCSETRRFTGHTGTLRYMAPEVALSKPYSHKAEVFAFATLMWEMASHERPFADCDVNGFYRCGDTPFQPLGAPHACPMQVPCPPLSPLPLTYPHSPIPFTFPAPLFSGACARRASGQISLRRSRHSSPICSPAAGAPNTPPVPRWPRSPPSCVSCSRNCLRLTRRRVVADVPFCDILG